jgi:hypothetical protein
MGRNLMRVALFAVIVFTPAGALANNRCTGMQAKCAVEIGGRCDPVTGHWEYGYARGAEFGHPPSGGNTTAYNDCISRALAKKK